MTVGDKVEAAGDRQAGGSMMEQLPPEITTHALSYLDYASLCRLSMTNSVMRNAANDDGFYSIIREGSLPAMSRLWLNADYVEYMQDSGGKFTGYDAVIDRWALRFDGQGIDVQIENVRAHFMRDDMVWMAMDAYVDVYFGPFHDTNVYEFHDGQWFMVYHISRRMLDVP
ncbi:hypothetical protein ZIOFF_028564 [Zingiber officinale]|uniref:F-box domain-containing protein n=1 Tax=Zingiber officinale TaxID=94328 RepID=A0A8J5L924_ZINOF|nr:hypothetical protein ZIOFF_028564 [Zingiber officinale]